MNGCAAQSTSAIKRHCFPTLKHLALYFKISSKILLGCPYLLTFLLEEWFFYKVSDIAFNISGQVNENSSKKVIRKFSWGKTFKEESGFKRRLFEWKDVKFRFKRAVGKVSVQLHVKEVTYTIALQAPMFIYLYVHKNRRQKKHNWKSHFTITKSISYISASTGRCR